jgi:hypothetical protein
MSVTIKNARAGWTEPFMFKFRTLELAGWAILLSVFAGFTASFGVGLAYERKLDIASILILPVVIGLLFSFLLAMPGIQRAVWIDHEGIHCVNLPFSNTGILLLMTSSNEWIWREVKSVELVRPGEGQNRYRHGIVVVVPKYASRALIGVSAEVSLEIIADVVHGFGIAVELSRWKPTIKEPVTA